MSVEFYGDEQNPTAIVIRAATRISGIEFFSPPSFSQQIGLMSRPKGYRVLPHTHNEVVRTILYTQEVLFVRQGECKVSIYDASKKLVNEILLVTGDTILLASGGHAIEMLKDTEILEVKQGPHLGSKDKTYLEL